MTAPENDPPLQRFRRSMIRDQDSWRDGIGYDLQALAAASPPERTEIEALLLRQAPLAWYDIEALAALDTPGARQALLEVLADDDPGVRAAVSRYAAGLIGDDARTAALVHGIETAEVYGGLTQVLLEVEEWHPPAVLDALLQAARRREGEVAIHLAAMLLYLGGVAKEPFDWDHRPFLLRFNTEDGVEREAVWAELKERIGEAKG